MVPGLGKSPVSTGGDDPNLASNSDMGRDFRSSVDCCCSSRVNVTMVTRPALVRSTMDMQVFPEIQNSLSNSGYATPMVKKSLPY
jgi:hypothetical protein